MVVADNGDSFVDCGNARDFVTHEDMIVLIVVLGSLGRLVNFLLGVLAWKSYRSTLAIVGLICDDLRSAD